ncbi:hypothetical protein J2Z23_001118 [Lederbergia galactosidilyticus]|nr:hypothetical protein [Lederbergia galactosidilytica]
MSRRIIRYDEEYGNTAVWMLYTVVLITNISRKVSEGF